MSKDFLISSKNDHNSFICIRIPNPTHFYHVLLLLLLLLLLIIIMMMMMMMMILILLIGLLLLLLIGPLIPLVTTIAILQPLKLLVVNVVAIMVPFSLQ